MSYLRMVVVVGGLLVERTGRLIIGGPGSRVRRVLDGVAGGMIVDAVDATVGNITFYANHTLHQRV